MSKSENLSDMKFSGKEEDFEIYKATIEKYARRKDMEYREKLLDKSKKGTVMEAKITMAEMLQREMLLPKDEDHRAKFEYDMCYSKLQELLARTLPNNFKKQQGAAFLDEPPHKMWKTVQEKFGAVTPWKFVEMQRKFQEVKEFKNVEQLIDHYTKLRTEINRDFKVLMKKKKDFITEYALCCQMLLSMPKSFWETITVTSSFFNQEFLTNTLRQKYAKRNLVYEDVIPVSHVKQLKLKRKRETPHGEAECWYCLKGGHRKKDCSVMKADRDKGIFKKNIHAPAKEPKEKVDTSAVAEKEMETPLSPPKDLFEDSKSDTASMLEYAEALGELEIEDTEKETVSIGCNAVGNASNSFVLDSGCGRHMTGNKDLFITLRKTNLIRFCYPNESISSGSEVGTIRLNVKTNFGVQTFLIPEVYYVPTCSRNLLCEFQLQQQGFVVQNKDGGSFKEIKKGAFKFKACTENGVYYVQFISDERRRKERTIEASQVLVRSKNQAINLFKEWHVKLGHVGAEALSYMLTHGLIKGGPTLSRKELEGLNFFCDTCARTKFRRMSYRNLVKSKPKGPLHTIHIDTFGPMNVNGYYNGKGGIRYVLVIVCDYTTHKWVFFMRSTTEVGSIIQDFVALIENQHGKHNNKLIHNINVIKRIRTDGGSEFKNSFMTDLCKKKGIVLEFSNVECHEENGGPERYNQTMMNYVRSLLDTANAKSYWWPEACAYGTYIENRCPRRRLKWKSAFELLHKRKPQMRHAKVWGTMCYAHNSAKKGVKKKLDPRAYRCMFLGYADQYKAYKVFNFVTQRVMASRDVRFSDTDRDRLLTIAFEPNKSVSLESAQPVDLSKGNDDKSEDENKDKDKENDDDRKEDEVTGEGGSTVASDTCNLQDTSPQGACTPSSDLGLLANEISSPRRVNGGDESHKDARVERRSSRGFQPPAYWNDYVCHHAEVQFGPRVEYKSYEIPKSYKAALWSPQREQWESAMQDELLSIEENKTWQLCELPKGRKALDAKWVYTVKYLASGEVERFKARLVVRGFRQKEGVDYDEIFSPVARMESFRLLLAISTILDLEIHQMDVKTAFLNGTLDPNLAIFVKVPEGYKKGKSGQVLRLLKSLYGLKQAPRVWYKLLHQFLTELGFKRCIKEYCLYVRRDGSTILLIVVYVDDLTLAGNSLAALRRVKAALAMRFKMTDLGELHYMLKIEIQRDRAKRLLSLSQEKYIREIVRKYGGSELSVRSVPLDPKLRLVPEETLKGEEVFAQPYPYRSLIGSLQYLVRGSRPDIANAVRELSKFLTRYNKTHWEAAVGVLGYLKGSVQYGLVYDGNVGRQITYQLYSDASFATQLPDRKSVLGYLSMLGGACVSYCSRSDTILATSTMYAEIAAVSEGCKESEWLWDLLKELGFEQKGPIVYWCDNQAAINVIENPTNHKASKAIEIRYLYARKLFEEGRIVMRYCKSEDMIADILTKSLNVGQFLKLRTALGVRKIIPKEA